MECFMKQIANEAGKKDDHFRKFYWSFGQMFTFCEKLPIILLAFALCKMRRHFIFEIEMTLVHAVTQPWG